MARKIPSSRSIKRNLGTKSPKFLIIAVCEGKNTEPQYLEKFASDHGNGLVRLELIAPAGAPITIVNKAVDKIKELCTKAKKKDANSFDKNYEVWAVFDVDEHPNIPKAMDMARANNVKTAISNPCIEIWVLLFFDFHGASIHRHDLQNKLAHLIPTYNPNGSKIIDYDLLRDGYAIAKKRAQKLMANHEETGVNFPQGNPSTNIYQLLDKIREQGN